MADLFNFADLADIEDSNPELAARFKKSENLDTTIAYANIVKAAAAAGRKAITLAQVQVVVQRMNDAGVEGAPVPATDTTVRRHLNTAIENGIIGKASRQSYCTLENVPDEIEEEEEVNEAGEYGADDLENAWTESDEEMFD